MFLPEAPSLLGLMEQEPVTLGPVGLGSQKGRLLSASHHRAPHILEAAPSIVQTAPMGKADWVGTETSAAQLWIVVVESRSQTLLRCPPASL